MLQILKFNARNKRVKSNRQLDNKQGMRNGEINIARFHLKNKHLMSLFRGSSFLKPHIIWHNMGGHNLAVGMKATLICVTF